MSTNNPLWSLFLESSCSSASVFFKLHLSTRSYFHSPTPWTNPNSNISRKVARLLDSFKPGSTSYCPFPNEEDTGNLTPGTPASPQNNENNEDARLVRPSEVATSNIIIQEQDTSTTLENSDLATSSEETMRRRLYLNVGRPRPFYRVSSSPASPSSSPEIQSFGEQNSVFPLQGNLINRPNKVSDYILLLYILERFAVQQQIEITFLIDQDSSDSSRTCQKLFCIKIRPRESFGNCQEWGTFLTTSTVNKVLSSHLPVYRV